MSRRIVFLKTRSVPADEYHDLTLKTPMPAPGAPRPLSPLFVPVMTHYPVESASERLRALFTPGTPSPGFASPPSSSAGPTEPGYGGLILTSQRAVEALAAVMASLPTTDSLPTLPVYAVGPATSRALRALSAQYGADWDVRDGTSAVAGTGEELSRCIAQDYPPRWSATPPPPLLFLTGDKRRDTIPTRLGEAHIPFDELVVYETRERPELAGDLTQTLFPALAPDSNEELGHTWVVVFSPMGCATLLDVLARGASKGQKGPGDASTLAGRPFSIVAIGPTTRDFLSNELKAEPDATADEPSARGVLDAVEKLLGQ